MNGENFNAGQTTRDETLVVRLRIALSAYRRRRTEVSCKRVLSALEDVCFSLCFGDEEFIRCLNPDSYAAAFVLSLSSAAPHDRAKIRPVAVQALALLADLVPQGAMAISVAKGVPPLIRLVKEVKPTENDVLLEDLLKCISHVSFEAHELMVRDHAVMAIVALETRVETHHVRMLCLKCLCHLFAAAHPDEWNIFLEKPCTLLVSRFYQQVGALLGNKQASERLSKESQAYLLRFIECIAMMFDRLLPLGRASIKNNDFLDRALPALVMVLERMLSMSLQGTSFRDAACSPLLSLFLADPSVAVKAFLKHRVLQSICGALATVLSGGTKQLSDNGKALSEALLGNDVNAIPCIAEEQETIPLLEFMLVVIPPTSSARESDYYVTVPYYVWEWEDDFHNKTDCSDSLSKQLEGEYERQRRSQHFTPYSVTSASRLLKVDFVNMRYLSNEEYSYYHTLHRHAIIAGYIHQRPTCCNCEEDTVSHVPAADSAPMYQYPQSRVRPKEGIFQQNAPAAAEAAAAAAAAATATTKAAVNPLRDGVSNEGLYPFNAQGVTTGATVRRNSPSTIFRREFGSTSTAAATAADNNNNDNNTDRLVIGKRSGFCCSCVDMIALKMGEKHGARRATRLQERGMSYKSVSCEAFRDVRDELLRSAFTRVQFLQGSMIHVLVSWCLPVMITVIQRTVNPVIARHCSILILRCVDLVTEYFRANYKSHDRSFSRQLRKKLVSLFPKLGTVLLYLAITDGSSRSVTASVYPFRELHTDQLFMQALMSLGLKASSRIPAPSLSCEMQMSALSAFLILRSSPLPEMNVFTDAQRFIVLQKIESIIGPIGRKQSLLRSSVYGSTGILLCPFHSTADSIEGVYERLMEQAGVLLRCGDRKASPQSSSNSPSLETHSESSDVYLPGECYMNPLSMGPTPTATICSGHSVLSDINAHMGKYPHFPLGIQQVIAIHEYTLEHGDDFSSLVYENHDFLENLANYLRDPAIGPALDVKAKEALTHIREGLSRVINEHTGLVNIDETCVAERQHPRIARRLRRSKVMVSMTDRMWAPLRLRLENITRKRCAEEILSRSSSLSHSSSSFPSSLASSSQTMSIGGRRYTFLDLHVDTNVFGILPTTPLSYLAKCILYEIHQQYVVSPGCRPEALAKRGAKEPDNVLFGGAFSFARPFLNGTETRGGGDGALSTSSTSTPQANSYSSEGLNIMNSSVSAIQLHQREEESKTGRILSALYAKVPVMQGEMPSTITWDNIVFFCNNKPVTDLSVSVLELCCNSSSILTDERAMMEDEMEEADEEEEGNIDNSAGRGASHIMQRAMKLWSMIHMIQYAIVNEPIVRDMDDVKLAEEANRSLCDPKRVFARLFKTRGIQRSLGVAANILNEIGRVLRVAGIGILHDERRICSALVHSFYNNLGALIMPPLTFPILWAHVSRQKDQHLASYILWNYPHVFSFDIRRTLLQLLLSVRRVPSPGLLKVKEALKRMAISFPVHGLEWITPNVNVQGTKKVMVPRGNILIGGARVLRCNAMCPLPLSVEFENEKGVGVGPALEFYNLFSGQLQEQQLRMWRTLEFMDASGAVTRRVQLPLFPSAHQTLESLSYFELVGLLLGRVLLEERVVDLPLHLCYIRGILGRLDENRLHEIDPQLDTYLNHLMTLEEEELEKCDLVFVLSHGDGEIPGSEVELCPNGALTRVGVDNVKEYCKAVEQYYCKTVLVRPLMHLMQGLQYAVTPHYLQLFDPDELQLLISGPDGKIWERPEDFQRVITTAHGYDNSSPVVMFLVDVVGNWSATLQRAFLRFVTGSSRIPVGGLQPSITVVRRAIGISDEKGGGGASLGDSLGEESVTIMQQLVDASLPTVNTCVHYLKLPSYSTKKHLLDKLHTAVTEGMESFFLT